MAGTRGVGQGRYGAGRGRHQPTVVRPTFPRTPQAPSQAQFPSLQPPAQGQLPPMGGISGVGMYPGMQPGMFPQFQWPSVQMYPPPQQMLQNQLLPFQNPAQFNQPQQQLPPSQSGSGGSLGVPQQPQSSNKFKKKQKTS